ncbi:MAG: methionyl-tRNA formyltransferase [Armatimonadetes bacterium]|nr:methionyl-tRNA formyltransferase [Armatimonadota bacterium]
MSIVLFSYYGNIGARVLEGLLAQGEEVLAVVARTSLKRPDYEPPVARVAFRGYIPVYRPVDVNDPAFVEVIGRLGADYFISMYSGRIFGEPLLRTPQVGCINMHNSLLPRWRGQSPSLWGLVAGDTEGGQTIHWLDPGVDTGDIIAQRAIPIDPEDTGGTFGQKLVDMGVPFFLETWPAIKAGRTPRARQDDSLATRCAAPKPEDWIIAWDRPAAGVHNHVRGFGPPSEGAITFFQGRTIRVRRTRVVDEPAPRADGAVPGQVLGSTGEGILVAAGEGAIVIREARFEDDGASLLAGPVLGPWCALGK